MRQVKKKLVSYASDLSGVCSALYELGGLLVMHDASGCNSTYATHDEPRWYAMNSMVYISGLTEFDAVLGNDDKLIRDILEVAEEKKPRFIAVFGSPVALMTGTDFRGIARLLEEETGIPSFAFKTTGMKSYICGANQAFSAYTERFLPEKKEGKHRIENPQEQIRVNLLGVTPLDFSVVGNVRALRQFLKDQGFRQISCFSMGDPPEKLQDAWQADVNLVCSSSALDQAEVLRKRYGIPSVFGLPVGISGVEKAAELIRMTAEDKKDRKLGSSCAKSDELNAESTPRKKEIQDPERRGAVIVGEGIFAASLRYALEKETGRTDVRIICPMERGEEFLRLGDVKTEEEEEIQEILRQTGLVIADPVYSRLIREEDPVRFIRFPQEACSGRIFREEIPVFIGKEFSARIRKWE